MNAEEAEKLAEDLVRLSIEQKQIAARIRSIKGALLEYTDIENLLDKVWMADNGHVEINTITKYKLAEVPAEVTVSPQIAAIDVAEKAFKSKVVLSKEGKKMFKEQHPSIMKLMIPNEKKEIKVVI